MSTPVEVLCKVNLFTNSMPFYHGQSLIVFVKIWAFIMGNLSKALWSKGNFWQVLTYLSFSRDQNSWNFAFWLRFAILASGTLSPVFPRSNLRAELQSLHLWQPICTSLEISDVHHAQCRVGNLCLGGAAITIPVTRVSNGKGGAGKDSRPPLLSHHIVLLSYLPWFN